MSLPSAPTPDPNQPSLPPLPRPSSSEPPNALEADLQEGLTAMAQQDYLTALAYFAAVAETAPEHPIGLQARMAMVMAYDRHGQPEQALAYCWSLTQHSNSQVREWAEQAMTSLKQQCPGVAHPQLDLPITALPDLPASPSLGSLEPQNPNTQPDPRTLLQQSTVINRSGQTFAPTRLPQSQTGPASLLGTAQTLPPPLFPQDYSWRQVNQRVPGKSLGRQKLALFYLAQGITAIVLVVVLAFTIRTGLLLLNRALLTLPWINPVQLLYRNPTWVVAIASLILALASPWLLDLLFKYRYAAQRLSLTQLTRYSPEATRIITQVSRRHKRSLPTLGLIPLSAPLILTYGSLPRTARIVVSQGLLDQLAEDEIATLYAAELAHWQRGSVILLSLALLVTQLPHWLYIKVAALADRWLGHAHHSGNLPLRYLWYLGTAGLAVVSCLSYLIYWLWRLPCLWVARWRVYYSDRTATELTGNPNGLTRALLKLAIGIVTDIQIQEQTSDAVHSLSFVSPLGYEVALSLGSACAHVSFETLLAWEQTNPYRRWFSLLLPHPPTGDRLALLTLYARHWKIEPELTWAPETPKQTLFTWRRWNAAPLRVTQQLIQFLRPVWVQGAPYISPLVGLALGFGIWGGAWVLDLLGWRQVGWIVGDRAILTGCIPMSISLAFFLRLNRYFPDIRNPSQARVRSLVNTRQSEVSQPVITEITLADILSDPTAVPADPIALQLSGKLLGRSGLANFLGQDLILLSETGLVRLQHIFRLGPIAELWLQPTPPRILVHQPVTVTGWFRRGASPWIDLKTLRHPSGRISYSEPAIWSAVLGCVSMLTGSLIILTGSR